MLTTVRSEGKRWAQRAVRAAHLLVPRELPDRIGIYFHDLPQADGFRFSAALAHLGELGYTFGGPNQLYQAGGEQGVLDQLRRQLPVVARGIGNAGRHRGHRHLLRVHLADP